MLSTSLTSTKYDIDSEIEGFQYFFLFLSALPLLVTLPSGSKVGSHVIVAFTPHLMSGMYRLYIGYVIQYLIYHIAAIAHTYLQIH
jgi:hypothetical protein